MNLKESFRYQNFLDKLMSQASYSIMNPEHGLKTQKLHHKNAANPDAQDIVEDVVPGHKFYPNDEVIRFMLWLTSEKEQLSVAIGKAKATLPFDIDAAVETNKSRHCMSSAIKSMLEFTPSKVIDVGKDYKFNVDGNQVQYFYNIDVEKTEAYDRPTAKATLKAITIKADKISNDIDAALVNTQVDYNPTYDVNDSFEDVMEEFVKKT